MKAIRNIIIASVAVGFVFALSSCSSRHTCPTYSQAKVQVEQKA